MALTAQQSTKSGAVKVGASNRVGTATSTTINAVSSVAVSVVAMSVVGAGASVGTSRVGAVIVGTGDCAPMIIQGRAFGANGTGTINQDVLSGATRQQVSAAQARKEQQSM